MRCSLPGSNEEGLRHVVLLAVLRDKAKAIPDSTLWREIEQTLLTNPFKHRFNRIEVTTAYPFLLSVYHDFSLGRISECEFAEVIGVLENFMIRRFVCGVPTYGLNKVFAALYSQANQNPSIVAGLKDALRTKNYPRDVEFRERFVSTKLYGGGDRVEKTKIILESSRGFPRRKPLVFAFLSSLMPRKTG